MLALAAKKLLMENQNHELHTKQLMVFMFRHSQRYLHSLHLIGFYFAYSLNQEITL